MQLLDAMKNIASASSEETLVKAQVLDVVSAIVGPSGGDNTVSTPGVTETLITEAIDVMETVMATAKEDMPALIGSFGVALSGVALSLDSNTRNSRTITAEPKASSVTSRFSTLATGLCGVLVSHSLDGEDATGAATNRFSLSCQKDAVNPAGAISIKPLSLQSRVQAKQEGPAHRMQLNMDIRAEYSATFMQGPPGAFTSGTGASTRRRRLAEAVRTQRAVTAAELRMELSSQPRSNQKLRASMRVELSPKSACGGGRGGCSIQNLHGDVHLRDSTRHGVLTHINFIGNGDGGLIQKFYTAEMLALEATAKSLFNKIGQSRKHDKPQRSTVVITVLERKSQFLDKLIEINEVSRCTSCQGTVALIFGFYILLFSMMHTLSG